MTWPDEAEWSAALAALTGTEEVVIACHVAPDGDALGSMLALGLALRARGTRVCCTWGVVPMTAPPVVPPAYAGLPGLDLLVPPAQAPSAPAVLVTVDSGSVDRLGSMAPAVERAGTVLVVDHHASNTRFGDVHLVDPGAAATAVLVEELVCRLGVRLTPEIAAGVYTGVVTDTGNFKYAATTPATHELAARLLSAGVRHDELTRAIYDTNSFGYVQLLGDVLSAAVLEADEVGGLGLVWAVVPLEERAACGVRIEEVEGVIDVVRTAREAEVAAVLKGDDDGTWKVSLRAKGAVDVGAVCTRLGGGGHRFAAGFTATGDPKVVLEEIREGLADAPHLPPE